MALGTIDQPATSEAAYTRCKTGLNHITQLDYYKCLTTEEFPDHTSHSALHKQDSFLRCVGQGFISAKCFTIVSSCYNVFVGMEKSISISPHLGALSYSCSCLHDQSSTSEASRFHTLAMDFGSLGRSK